MIADFSGNPPQEYALINQRRTGHGLPLSAVKGSENDGNRNILKILQEDIHSTIVATLDEEGRPQTRAIDIMLIAAGKPVF